MDESVHHGVQRKDKRKARTDYWQTREEVDVYKDEVKAGAKAKVRTPISCVGLIN